MGKLQGQTTICWKTTSVSAKKRSKGSSTQSYPLERTKPWKVFASFSCKLARIASQRKRSTDLPLALKPENAWRSNLLSSWFRLLRICSSVLPREWHVFDLQVCVLKTFVRYGLGQAASRAFWCILKDFEKRKDRIHKRPFVRSRLARILFSRLSDCFSYMLLRCASLKMAVIEKRCRWSYARGLQGSARPWQAPLPSQRRLGR